MNPNLELHAPYIIGFVIDFGNTEEWSSTLQNFKSKLQELIKS
jgi:hypothetical protein